MRPLYAATSEGHFVDRTVGKLTDLEKGTQVADAVATGIEYLVLAAVFVIPILMLLGGLRSRKAVNILGGVAATAGDLVPKHRRLGPTTKFDSRQMANSRR